MDYRELNGMIDRLRCMVEEPEDDDRARWKPVWDAANEIGAAFRLVSYPSTWENDAAWARYQEAIMRSRQRFQEQQDMRQEEREAEREQQRRCGQRVIAVARRAADGVASSVLAAEGELAAAHEAVRARKGTQAAIWPFADINDLRKALASSKKMLAESNEPLQDAWKEFRDSKEGMLADDRDAVYAMLAEARDALKAAWVQWRERTGELHDAYRKLGQEQRRQRERSERNSAARNARKKRKNKIKKRAVARMARFRGNYR